MNNNLTKTFFLVLAIMFFASCKKSYTCECTADYGGGVKATQKSTIKKASKREAENLCKDFDLTDISPSGTDTYKVSCSLK